MLGTMTTNEDNKPFWERRPRWFVVIVLGVVASLTAAWAYWVLHWGSGMRPPGAEPGTPGLTPNEFGDAFGPLTTLFTAFTLGAAIWALLMQRQELKENRAVMEKQWEEMERQAEALQEQVDVARQQVRSEMRSDLIVTEAGPTMKADRCPRISVAVTNPTDARQVVRRVGFRYKVTRGKFDIVWSVPEMPIILADSWRPLHVDLPPLASGTRVAEVSVLVEDGHGRVAEISGPEVQRWADEAIALFHEQ